MTIDEAIKHCEEKTKELRERADVFDGITSEADVIDCIECAEEHEQLAEWLKDYKRLLEEQPQGEWIRVDKDKMKCNKCEVIHFIAQYPPSAKIDYCPNCGAKMKQG